MITRSCTRPRYLLPPEAYFDADWFARERSALFDANWTLVASTAEVAGPGAYLATMVGRAPVIVVCGEDNVLHAFHNMCRHRGAVLLEGRGTLGSTINCFYHQWRYGFDGSVQVIPQRKDQFPDLDPCEWGLLPAAVEVWEGMVFVHPDPAAPPLGTILAGFPEHLGSHRPSLLTQVAVRRLDARCNWKLFVENHVDVYHLWHLHAETLGDWDHTRFSHTQIGRNWASYEPRKASAPPQTPQLPISHLSDKDRDGIGAHLVFPNLMMAANCDWFATYVAHPVAPDRSVIELRLRGEPGADPEHLVAAAVSFISEDIAACEAIQAAVQSPWFTVGPLAVDHEAPIEAFQSHVLDAMSAHG